MIKDEINVTLISIIPEISFLSEEPKTTECSIMQMHNNTNTEVSCLSLRENDQLIQYPAWAANCDGSFPVKAKPVAYWYKKKTFFKKNIRTLNVKLRVYKWSFIKKYKLIGRSGEHQWEGDVNIPQENFRGISIDIDVQVSFSMPLNYQKKTVHDFYKIDDDFFWYLVEADKRKGIIDRGDSDLSFYDQYILHNIQMTFYWIHTPNDPIECSNGIWLEVLDEIAIAINTFPTFKRDTLGIITSIAKYLFFKRNSVYTGSDNYITKLSIESDPIFDIRAFLMNMRKMVNCEDQSYAMYQYLASIGILVHIIGKKDVEIHNQRIVGSKRLLNGRFRYHYYCRYVHDKPSLAIDSTIGPLILINDKRYHNIINASENNEISVFPDIYFHKKNSSEVSPFIKGAIELSAGYSLFQPTDLLLLFPFHCQETIIPNFRDVIESLLPDGVINKYEYIIPGIDLICRVYYCQYHESIIYLKIYIKHGNDDCLNQGTIQELVSNLNSLWQNSNVRVECDDTEEPKKMLLIENKTFYVYGECNLTYEVYTDRNNLDLRDIINKLKQHEIAYDKDKSKFSEQFRNEKLVVDHEGPTECRVILAVPKIDISLFYFKLVISNDADYQIIGEKNVGQQYVLNFRKKQMAMNMDNVIYVIVVDKDQLDWISFCADLTQC